MSEGLFKLLVVLAIIGGAVVVIIIGAFIMWVVETIAFKIQDYKENYLKYRSYYLEHHTKIGLFDFEIETKVDDEESKEEEDGVIQKEKTRATKENDNDTE